MPSTNQTIAFATCNELPHPADDDELLANYLRAAGFEVKYAIWNNENVRWENFSLILIRSTWDYHANISAWYAWLQSLEEKQLNVWNPSKTLQWNTHKSYLKELQEKDIQIVPTVFIAKGNPHNLHEILTSNDWARAVVKPAISLNAYQTWRINIEDTLKQQADFEALIAEKDVLIQQFMPEIQSEGEWSLLFFGGQFSHAVLKSNPTGDFRIHEHHGGLNRKMEASPTAILQAKKILQSIDYPYHYARVDVILRGKQVILMELELIEPSLFLDLDQEAVQRLGSLIEQFLKN